MASSYAATPAHPPPQPPPLPPAAAKKSFLRRIIPVFLVTNVIVGVYVFTRTWQKQPSKKDEEEPAVKFSSVPAGTKDAMIPERKNSTEATTSLKALPPIPEHQQRELFKWILEEKRKVKPRNKLEKKKIDEEKALLKEFIQAKSIPSL